MTKDQKHELYECEMLFEMIAMHGIYELSDEAISCLAWAGSYRLQRLDKGMDFNPENYDEVLSEAEKYIDRDDGSE